MNEKFEDINGLIRNRKSKDRQYNVQTKRTKGPTIIYNTLYRNLKIEEHEPHQKSRVNSFAPEM